MKKKVTSLALFAFSVLMSSTSMAGTLRTLDANQITVTGTGNVLTLPSITDTVSTATSSEVLSNKSISGSSNTLTNLPVSALSGQVSVANGGTGDSTLTSNGMLFGNGTSAVGITAAGSQYQVFQSGSGGVPTVGALQLGQSAAVSGQLGVANGGTGSSTLTANNLVVGNGTSAVSFIAPGTSGYVLTSNGTTWSSAAAPVTTPSLNGGSASPQSVTAAGGITLTSLAYENFVWVTGSSGAVVVTAVPSVTACTADGQRLHIIGTSATNTVTLQDAAGLSGSGLQLNGTWVGSQYSVLNLHCDVTLGAWVEDSRR